MRLWLSALIALFLLSTAAEARDWGYKKKQAQRSKYTKVSPKQFKDRHYFRLTYSDKAQYRDLELLDSDLVNFTFGRTNPGLYKIGSYIHFGINFIDTEDYDDYPTTRGRWRILGAGASVTLWPGLQVYGGPGWAWAEALDIKCKGCDAEERDIDGEYDELNWHAGFDYSWGKVLGLAVEYDSAPDAVSVGVSFYFE